MNTSAWFITTIPDFVHQEKRTVGFYFEKENAIENIRNNTGSLHEGIYTHLVLEKISTGIYGMLLEEHWYEWTENQWVPVSKPERFKGTINFAIG